jgi:ATP-binding cassette subfamily B protein
MSLSEIRRAASIACVDEAISEFTNGYDTIVGERGVTLSGGQKQRTAIARMLTQNTPIMVFDDSLSAVDADTDVRIRQELRKNLGDATVILIAHRVTTLMQADCIMVMDKGKIIEIGTHDQLMENGGIYRKIYDMQMSRDDETQEAAADN